MEHKFLEPIQVGKQTLKNRVVYLAMAKAMSGFDGKVSTRDIAYMETIAKGGVGLVIPGAMVCDPLWPSGMPMAPAIYDDAFLPGLTSLAKAAHNNGAKILFQPWHPGAVDYTGGNPPTIDDISVDEIHRIQGCFVDAAKRAMRAGADGVEFQMCHTYLANQFLSPLWNHRTDEYGGDTVENRLRFSLETLKMIREAIGPDKILSVKLQGFDFPKGEGPDGNDGITPEMAAEYAPYIERAGADMITVSAGGSLTGRDDIMTGDVHRAEGWKVPAARLVKQTVSIPVVATGSIRHPEYVDQIMADGSCDMVGMGRGLFAERNWVNKCAEGKEDQLRYCISCMNCWNSNPFAKNVSNCSVNPFGCREDSMRPLKVDGNGRIVAIVGAGPAGMEAAITLKQRGFTPVVFEKENRIGGNVNIAKKPPFKGKFQWQIDYYEKMVKALDIDVRMGTEATLETIMALNPYTVLIATGSVVTAPPIPGLDQVETVQSRDVLDQNMKFQGKKMAVIGGGITGMEVALYLKAQGNEVSIVDFMPTFPLDMYAGDPRFMMEAKLETEHCMEKGIQMCYSNKVLKFESGKLHLEHAETGEASTISADVVVLSTGVKPNDTLYNALLAAGCNVWKVGDANVTDKIYKAVMNGSKFAYALK